MSQPVRQFKQVIFRGHGWQKSAKESKETDIVISADKNEPGIQKIIDSMTRGFVMYLMTSDFDLPQITAKHPALKDKAAKGFAIDDESQSLIVFVN